jgi:hypothetical protein
MDGCARHVTNGSEGVWSVFFEPGVSRHLPLGGAFGQIVFSRPVSFSLSRPMRMITLSSEPSELIGYRIYNGSR